MLLRLLIVIIGIFVSLFPPGVSAHGSDSPIIVVINDREIEPNPVSATVESDSFPIVEDVASELFQVSEPLTFSLRPSPPLTKEELNHYQITWDFNGEKKQTGINITTSFKKAGSIIGKVTLSSDETAEPTTHSFRFTVVPNDTYTFPQVEMSINGKHIENMNEAILVNLSTDVTFAASSDTKGLTYQWNFDNGDTAVGSQVTYQYSQAPYLATPILRATDKHGIYQDFQLSLKNTHFGEKPFPIHLFILVGGITLAIAIGILILRKKRHLNKRK